MDVVNAKQARIAQEAGVRCIACLIYCFRQVIYKRRLARPKSRQVNKTCVMI